MFSLLPLAESFLAMTFIILSVICFSLLAVRIFFFLIYLEVCYHFIFFLFIVDFVIHWNETAMGLHVFPIPIPPPTSLSTRSL